MSVIDLSETDVTSITPDHKNCDSTVIDIFLSSLYSCTLLRV